MSTATPRTPSARTRGASGRASSGPAGSRSWRTWTPRAGSAPPHRAATACGCCGRGRSLDLERAVDAGLGFGVLHADADALAAEFGGASREGEAPDGRGPGWEVGDSGLGAGVAGREC